MEELVFKLFTEDNAFTFEELLDIVKDDLTDALMQLVTDKKLIIDFDNGEFTFSRRDKWD